jgi:hypothetical protein
MKTVSLRLPEALDARLTWLAQEKGVTRSAVVREALEAFMENGTARRPSAYDLSSDLCGSVTDAPRDLSYNKKYMEGFGE